MRDFARIHGIFLEVTHNHSRMHEFHRIHAICIDFEDDFQKIAESDWIIEVVVENLKIKMQIFE